MKLKADRVKQRYNELLELMAEADKSYMREIAGIKAELKILQSLCPHNFKYHPDPSGNNDSFYQCELCREERKRI
jgi:hypothetical protein